MKHYLWALIWGIFVVFLIVTPIDMNEGELSRFNFPGIDKLVHTGVFFVFTVLLFFASLKNSHSLKIISFSIILILIIASSFAIGTELIQEKLTTYRTFELWDIFADHVGIAMAYFAYLLFILAAKSIKPEF
jgi:VanZ family protein